MLYLSRPTSISLSIFIHLEMWIATAILISRWIKMRRTCRMIGRLKCTVRAESRNNLFINLYFFLKILRQLNMQQPVHKLKIRVYSNKWTGEWWKRGGLQVNSTRRRWRKGRGGGGALQKLVYVWWSCVCLVCAPRITRLPVKVLCHCPVLQHSLQVLAS